MAKMNVTAERVGCSPGLIDTINELTDGGLCLQDLVELLLSKAEAHSDLNGFITLNAAGVRAAARCEELSTTLLRGVPLVIKDNIHVAGLPNTAGTPGLRGFVPSQDAPAVARLRAAGATILGKTNMHELAFGVTSDNAAFGSVRNPYRTSCFAGGSSGGTAALIAAGVAPAGLATDTGGSARIPAALCGLCGFRPTLGRYPGEGVTPLSSTRDTVGAIARTVSDIVLLDAILAGCGGARRPPVRRIPASLRLGLPRTHFAQPLAEDVSAVWEATLGTLRAAGVTVVPVEVTRIVELDQTVAMPIVLNETRKELAQYLECYETGLNLESLADGIASPDVREIFFDGIVPGSPNEVGESTYASALAGRAELQRLYRALLAEQQLDAVAFPTTRSPALDLAESRTTNFAGRAFSTFDLMGGNTDPSAVAGIPSLTLPMGRTADGLPVGLSIDGRQGQDVELLEIGRSLEHVLSDAARPAVS